MHTDPRVNKIISAIEADAKEKDPNLVLQDDPFKKEVEYMLGAALVAFDTLLPMIVEAVIKEYDRQRAEPNAKILGAA